MNDVRAIWHAGATLEAMRAFCRNTMQEHVGIELVELGPDFLRGTMPVDHRTCQPMRLLHGGASVVLAETLASVAANMVVEVQTLDLRVNLDAENANRRVTSGHQSLLP